MLGIVWRGLGAAFHPIYRIACFDAKTRQLIDWRKVEVHGDLSEGPKSWTRRDYAELAGAYAGAAVYINLLPKVIQVLVDHGTFESPFRFVALFERDYEAPHSLLIQYIELSPEWQRHGILTRMFAIQAKAAARLGFERITVEAALKGDSHAGTSKKFHGYYTWVRLGFDDPLPQAWRDAQTAPFSACELVSEVMNSERGRRHWLEHGLSMKLVFGLNPSSNGWGILARYLQQTRIRVSQCGLRKILTLMQKKLGPSGRENSVQNT